MKLLALSTLLIVASVHAAEDVGAPRDARAAEAGVVGNVAPFAAHYTAYWKSIAVGTSDIVLKREAEPGRYVYIWTITARGIFRLAYSDDLVQTSWLRIRDDRVWPEKYRGKEGSKTVELNFDWENAHATGVSETKPVDLKLEPGTQDVMSIQVQVMVDLMRGQLPTIFHIIDKDQLKDFDYTNEGAAKIRTDIGELDTVVVTSHRPGNNRILRMWFAPSLGFIPVQAERSRDGKLEFAFRIRSFNQ